MERYRREIQRCHLFYGVREEDLEPMLTCAGARVVSCAAGAYLEERESIHKQIGVVLAGEVQIVQTDAEGNERILARMEKTQVFGESFSVGYASPSSVRYFSPDGAVALLLPFERVMQACNLSCVFHHRLIENMLSLIADKNKLLVEKVEIVSKKTLREKILAYLNFQAEKQGKKYFEIPLNRFELANYLCADRSAMSRELARMKKDGLIDYDRNTFHLLCGEGAK